MTPEDIAKIIRWGEHQEKEIRLGLAVDGSDSGKHMSDFCDRMTALVPGIFFERKDDGVVPMPSILIRRNICYQAVPLGVELTPFLEAISGQDAGTRSYSDEIARLVSQLRTTLSIKIYIAPHCPHCPQVVTKLLDLAAAWSRIHVNVIDTVLLPEMAFADQVRSVPTTILDGEFRWTGLFSIAEMLAVGVSRDFVNISVDALRNMLEAGEAEVIAERMRVSGKIFPAIVELLVHEKWPVRLGAMVAVEYLADSDPALADELAEPLWKRFWDLPHPVKGDVVHVFGLLSRNAVDRCLNEIIAKTDAADLLEAVAEARQQLV